MMSKIGTSQHCYITTPDVYYLEILKVKEAKIEAKNHNIIEETITKKIRSIPNVTTTTTLSIVPEQD